MGFDWSTFVLEVVNFLVLVWLLKRFLYQPVLAMIERRQADVRRTLLDAEAARDEARRLQAAHEARGSQWDQELAQRRQALDDALQAEWRKRLQALDVELAEERQRREAKYARELDARGQALQARAESQARQFATSLLGRLAGPELERRILDMLIEDLAAMPAAGRQALAGAFVPGAGTVVASTVALPEEDRNRLESVLATFARGIAVRYTIDPQLLAGVRIKAGAWELDASLAGELRAFSELAGHG